MRGAGWEPAWWPAAWRCFPRDSGGRGGGDRGCVSVVRHSCLRVWKGTGVGRQKSEVGKQESGVRSQKSEDRRQKSEDRSQKSEPRCFGPETGAGFRRRIPGCDRVTFKASN